MKKLVFALVVAAFTATAAPSFAQETTEDWVNKTMAFGLGSGRTIGGGTGLSLRLYPVESFGLEVVFGGSSMKRTVQNQQPQGTGAPAVEYITRSSEIAFSLLADFRFLRSNRSALSAFAGVGIVNDGVRGTYVQTINGTQVGQKITDSFTDLYVSLGLRGELFLYKFFSVHGRVGITIDPYADGEGNFAGSPEGIPDPTVAQIDTTDYGGVDISIFNQADLFGSMGFTLWFN